MKTSWGVCPILGGWGPGQGLLGLPQKTGSSGFVVYFRFRCLLPGFGSGGHLLLSSPRGQPCPGKGKAADTCDPSNTMTTNSSRGSSSDVGHSHNSEYRPALRLQHGCAGVDLCFPLRRKIRKGLAIGTTRQKSAVPRRLVIKEKLLPQTR